MSKSKRPNDDARPHRTRARIALLIAVVLALLAALPLPPAHAQPPAWDAADLEAFLDPIIAQGMAENHIPGVALLLASGLAAIALGLAVPAWRRRAWPTRGRWLYTAYAVIAVKSLDTVIASGPLRVRATPTG